MHNGGDIRSASENGGNSRRSKKELQALIVDQATHHPAINISAIVVGVSRPQQHT